MSSDKLQIYKASAGSGKTFKLTEKFLLLAFRQPDYFTRVLAVTFTNKAAEEMKARILEELDLLVNSPEKADHADTISRYFPQWSLKQLQKQAAQIRDLILHRYSRFSVSTIDSFVQKILRAFAYEIGAQTGYQVEMDMDRVVAELTERMEQRLKTDEQLMEWLIRFATFRADNGKSWNFRNEITDLAKIIFSEAFQALTRQKNALPDKPQLKGIEEELRQMRFGYEKQINRIGRDALKIIEKYGMRYGDFGSNFKNLRNYLQKVSKGKARKDFEPGKTVKSMLAGDKAWYTKKLENEAKKNPEAQEKVDKLEALEKALAPLMNELTNLRKNKETQYVTASAILENLHTYGILSDLASLLPEYRENHNALLISDANMLLRDIVEGNEAPFIFEKTGNTFQHILIDEFQDTSHFQWDNFRPLVINALASGNYNLIVGDVKQSIYRWRGGDWKLLLQQVRKDIGNELVEETSLAYNFRSHEQIIRMNNTVFHYAPVLLQGRYNNEIEENLTEDDRQELVEAGLTEIFKKAYSDSYQKPGIPDKTEGRVHIEFVKSTKLHETVAEQLPQLVERLIREDEYQPGEIGILVRRNAEATEVHDLLMKYQQTTEGAAQYRVVSPESLTLYTSPAIRTLISAMQFLNNRDATIHLANLMYQHHRMQDKQITHELFAEAAAGRIPEGMLPEEFVNHADELASLSVYEMAERLIRIFGLDKLPADQPYLTAFLDFALQFSRNDASDLAAFLEWWQESGMHQSVEPPESPDAVRILTIHKAKGLAFDAVIVPFANWKMDHERNPVIWCRPEAEGFSHIPSVPVTYKQELLHSHFYFHYFAEKAYATMDALNALYVAMTRPRAQLYVMAGLSGQNSKTYRAGDLLHELMQYNAPDLHNYYLRFKELYDSNTQQMEAGVKPEIPETTKADPAEEFSLEGKVTNWRSRISIKQYAKEFFIEAVESIRKKVDYGTVMHEILSRIQQPEDLDPAVQAAFFEGKIALEDLPAIKRQIQNYIDYPEAQDWFYGDLDVHTELPILTADGEQRIADRVLEGEDHVVVIDYKFGSPQPENHEQVREYMQLLHEIFELPVQGYLYYPDMPKVEKVKLVDE